MSTTPSESDGDRAASELYRRSVTRRSMLVGSGALAALGLAGCASATTAPGGNATAPATEVFFGYVFGRPEITAIAFDLDPPGADGARTVRAYVCDGLGIPTGLALWFTGPVDPAKTAGLDTVVTLPSASGKETIEIGNVADFEIRGTFVDADKARFRFVSNPATAGAGIYQVTVDQELNYRGTSTVGDTLEGRLADGKVTGTLTTAAGEKIDFVQEVIAFASAARQAQVGNSGAATAYKANSGVPGEYVAVLSPGGTAAFGRSGNVRKGTPGGDIIGLDKSD